MLVAVERVGAVAEAYIGGLTTCAVTSESARVVVGGRYLARVGEEEVDTVLGRETWANDCASGHVSARRRSVDL